MCSKQYENSLSEVRSAELGNFVCHKYLNICIFKCCMVEKKKEQKKDPFEEIIEILESYEEGTLPRKIDDWGE